MGHSRLGTLPDTAPWNRVVGLIAGGGNVAAIAGATSQAAQNGLELADGDEGLKQTFYLLSQIALAARADDFVGALADSGFAVPGEPSVLGLVGAFSDAIDQHLLKTRSRTDVGEMAQLAAAESLTAILSERSRSLFGTTEVEVQAALKSCSTQAGFAGLAHDFFSRFTQRYLTYHLGRELPNHVGDGGRFDTPGDHTAFVDELRTHCRQAAQIVRDFAGDWYSKQNFEGGITPRKVKGFIHVALDKVRRELKVRGERDA